jgi:hypothetical protein
MSEKSEEVGQSLRVSADGFANSLSSIATAAGQIQMGVAGI